MAPFYSWVTGVLALSGSLVTASPVKRGPVVNEPINAVSTPYGEMSYTELPNNRSQLDLYTGGVYQGTILAHENGANVFGPDGVEINLNTDLATMTGPWENFLRAMGWLAVQFGVKAVRWLFCVVVTNKAYDCLPKFTTCGQQGISPYQCKAGLDCAADAVNKCPIL
ncbi:hypothetical protein HFD88_003905 [Aspergillus terreus]|nr:hypothetical protein HFD88_003905 [Aspergillus terreus]